ncbi:hypothetical protein MFIFM68171_01049 [Madurella fahalii]|uniref:Uncharacterized protein n=1 Tax=Madurella fahalii TaxID=1157608 RepID=A0ABQ0FZB4_9PEZI
MNRQAMQAALGRAAPLSQCLRATKQSTAYFSTTTPRPENRPNGRERSEAAALKIAQLGYKNRQQPSSERDGSEKKSPPGPFGNEKPQQQQQQRPIIRRIQAAASPAGRAVGVDARSLRATPIKPAGAGPGGAGIAAPKVLNLRSIRGTLGPGPPRLAGARGGAGPAKLGFGLGAGRLGGGIFGGAGGAARGGAARRGRPRKPRPGAQGEQDGQRQKDLEGNWKKLTPEEQEIVDRLEKGEEVRFDPKLTLAELSGYGAAVATDAALGQVETAIRAMRVMTGGMAFNAHSGVTADITAVMKRYEKKQPIFLHSTGEKEWIERAKPKHQLVGPSAETKKAIIDSTILGKYEATGFAAIGNVKATMANYHGRTFTYRASDSEKFMNKVLSLMPAQAAGQPAAQAKRA